jgi:hypothetical protein
MNLLEFYKKNFFEVFFCIALTIGGLYRLMNPEIRERERAAMHIGEALQWVIVVAELSSVYFLFYSTPYIKKAYLAIFATACIVIGLYYLSLQDILTELKNVSIFTPEMPNILFHLTYVYIIGYLLFIKKN